MEKSNRPNSLLVILRRAYLNITGNHCAAKLIEYFKHWRDWKVKNHRTDWIYMPMRQIHEDLMGEHSLHVIRAAIALLEKLGFLKRRQNPGNGQDKTYQYQLQLQVIGSLTAKSVGTNPSVGVLRAEGVEVKAESREVKTESPMLGSELSENNAEQHTQITTTDIQNTNITPTKQEVSVENCFPQVQNPEKLIEKYESRLKTYCIYRESWSGDKLVPNPKMKQVLQVLTKVPPDRAERSILAFLGWFKNVDARTIKDKYKALESAIAKDWELAQ